MKKKYTIIVNFLFFTFLIFVAIGSYIYIKRSKVSQDDLGSLTKYVVKIELNGATSVDNDNLSCTVMDDHCLITLPNAYRDDGNIIGYHTTSNAHIALYQVGEQIDINKNFTLYVISQEKRNLIIDDHNIDYLKSNDNYCYLYNREKSCTVKVPAFNKIGYEVRGYSTRQDSMTGYIFPNTLYTLTKDTTIYPIYNTIARARVINVSRNYMIGNMIFDVESGCNEQIYSEYLDYFQIIYQKAPYLSIGSKITLLNDDTFNLIWGSQYAGMNYGPISLRLFDIRCSNTIPNDYYATIVHELAHTWDLYYSNYFDQNISDQSDIINLFNKYKNTTNRPFRDYSYTNIKEFFADIVRYYYLKYVDPTMEYSLLSYPQDIKETLEKYICITNNDYNNKKC